MKPDKFNYIPTLDGWRAIAILLVLFDHGVLATYRPYGWARIGAHGVQVFFVLSGYLITGKLLEDGSLWRFYTRRVFRILPVLLAYLAVICVLGFCFKKIPLLKSEVITSLLFVRNYVFYPLLPSTGASWFTAHLWSLSIEEQFYLLWPILMLKVVRGSPRRRLFVGLGWFGFWIVVLALTHFGRVLHFYEGLIIGCLLRLALSDAGISVGARKAFSRRSGLVVIGVLVYILITRYHTSFFDPIVCGLGLCATLVEPNGWPGRVLELSVLRWIGRLSYSLYIWQELFLGFGVVFRPVGVFSRFPINVASAVVVACLSYYLMERPLVRFGHRLSKSSELRRRKVAEPALEPAPRT